MEEYGLKIIARVRSDFPEKFGIPRQSGLIEELTSEIVFEPEYREPEALRGIEGFSHLWLIWQFSECIRDDWQPTVRPPRLGGNKRLGVFATRAPYRPNSLGLSSVRLLGVEYDSKRGPVLKIGGADLMDGTPIFDIKPYLSYTDSHPDALGGFAAPLIDYCVEVNFPNELLQRIPEHKREALIEVLKNDPRPGYQNDPEREYKMSFAGAEIAFKVSDGVLNVTDVVS